MFYLQNKYKVRVSVDCRVQAKIFNYYKSEKIVNFLNPLLSMYVLYSLNLLLLVVSNMKNLFPGWKAGNQSCKTHKGHEVTTFDSSKMYF